MIVALLLDTCVVLFALREPSRIRSALRSRIEREPCIVSAVSFYEIALKVRLGKLTMPADFDLADWLAATQIDVTPVFARHASAAGRLPLANRDPWDRIIVALALLDGHELVSSDDKLDLLGAPRLW